jgi:hypothetical protein
MEKRRQRAQQIYSPLGVTMKHDRAIKELQPANHVWRAAAAMLRAHIAQAPPEQMAKIMYPDDTVTPVLTRAASTMATLTDPAWAGPLARYAVSQAIEDIVAMTAAGRMEAAGAMRVDMGRLASVTVPGRGTTAADAGNWVAEGAPIPAKQYNYAPGKLNLRKLAVIVTLTEEMSRASNLEDLLRTMLTQAAGMAIDAQMFSTIAGDATKPVGLFNGLTPITPTAATASGFDACSQDLGLLAQDIATRGGGRRAFFIAAPAQAISIKFYTGGGDVFPLAASSGMAAKSAACIEPESLAFAIADPEFAVGNVAAIQQEDTAPADLLTIPPVKSMFQIDAIALRMVVFAAWAMRAPHAAYMTAVNW